MVDETLEKAPQGRQMPQWSPDRAARYFIRGVCPPVLLIQLVFLLITLLILLLLLGQVRPDHIAQDLTVTEQTARPDHTKTTQEPTRPD